LAIINVANTSLLLSIESYNFNYLPEPEINGLSNNTQDITTIDSTIYCVKLKDLNKTYSEDLSVG
jgi:hypothetical protein